MGHPARSRVLGWLAAACSPHLLPRSPAKSGGKEAARGGATGVGMVNQPPTGVEHDDRSFLEAVATAGADRHWRIAF